VVKENIQLVWPKDIPIKNFIGIDIKGARFWRGAKTAIDEGLKCSFLNSNRINQSYFAENEVDEIWITFQIPNQIQKKHRMTNSEFCNCIKKYSKKDGVNLKTDSSCMDIHLVYFMVKDTKFVCESQCICEEVGGSN
jgi:tRNA (guanine-N7-)-methyltransferase